MRSTSRSDLKATSNPKEIPACDFGIFATKSPHTRSAIEQTAHVFGPSSAVCSVQNGLGNEEIIAERVKHVIRGATTMAAHLIAPGHAGFEFYSNLWIGPFEPSGTPYACVEQLAELLNRYGPARRSAGRRAWRAVDQTDFQFGSQSGGRAHPLASRRGHQISADERAL